jgi:signal transduction histidine kinase/HAMP domain-containing protein
MKIRTKLFLFFILTTIFPLIVGINFIVSTVRQALIARSSEKLEALVLAQKHRIEQLLERYKERAELITSRTTLRQNLAQYNLAPKDELKHNIQKILEDARGSSGKIISIYILDNFGQPLLAGDFKLTIPAEVKNSDLLKKINSPVIEPIKIYDQKLIIRVIAPLDFAGARLGYLVIDSDGHELFEVASDRAGLRETGELMLVAPDTQRNVIYITPPRFKPELRLTATAVGDRSNILPLMAISGREAAFYGDGLVDYRGEKIFAATAYIKEVNWGLIAKIDRSEAFSPIATITVYIWSITAIFYAIAISGWLWISHYLIKRIRKMVYVAQEVRSGNYGVKIGENGRDELGELGQVFDSVIVEVSTMRSNLEGLVKERTLELEQVHARDEAILENISDGLVFVDMKGRFVIFNQAAEKILGIGAVKEGMSQWPEVYGIFYKDGKTNVPSDQMPIARTLRGESISREIYLIRNAHVPKGVLISVSADPVKDKDGKQIGGLVIFRDVTEERAVDKAKSEFVSLASHQLRSPLSVINWYIELLMSGEAGNLTVGQKKYIHEIYAGSKRMSDLIGALLNVSRLELGIFAVEPVPTSIPSVVKSTIKNHVHEFKNKKINLATRLQNVPKINLDPKLFNIVVDNLITNAIKYTPAGGRIGVHFGLRRAGSELGGRLVPEDSFFVQVTDNGIGIPAYQQDKIFEKLFRADNAQTASAGGTGLGLYIAKMIVDYARGMIWFDSVENKGTTFYVVMPLRGMESRAGLKKLS